MRILLSFSLLLVGCNSKLETYVNEKYKFTCEVVEKQQGNVGSYELQRCENFEMICMSSALIVLVFPSTTHTCMRK